MIWYQAGSVCNKHDRQSWMSKTRVLALSVTRYPLRGDGRKIAQRGSALDLGKNKWNSLDWCESVHAAPYNKWRHEPERQLSIWIRIRFLMKTMGMTGGRLQLSTPGLYVSPVALQPPVVEASHLSHKQFRRGWIVSDTWHLYLQWRRSYGICGKKYKKR